MATQLKAIQALPDLGEADLRFLKSDRWNASGPGKPGDSACAKSSHGPIPKITRIHSPKRGKKHLSPWQSMALHANAWQSPDIEQPGQISLKRPISLTFAVYLLDLPRTGLLYARMPLELPQIPIFGMIGPYSLNYQCLRQVLRGPEIGRKPIDNGKTGTRSTNTGFPAPLDLRFLTTARIILSRISP